MHVSLDGFAATPDRGLNWIHLDEGVFDYADNQTDNADTALYGRVTYELMDNYWPTAADEPGASKHDIHHSAWYNNVEKVVLSRTMKDTHAKNARFIGENVPAEIQKLKEKSGKNIIMFGSPGTVRSLLRDRLIDELWLFINPVILGEGIPYLRDAKVHIKLELISSKTFSSGLVCVQYITK
jgi:dihydrofolate reductase